MANFSVLNRKLHRWGSIITAIPFLIVLISGLFLQVKKQMTWVQPPERKTSNTVPGVDLHAMYQVAMAVPEAGITGWQDVDRIDVRPRKGFAKVKSRSNWEVQVDIGTGEILESGYTRESFLKHLHEGSYFADFAVLWIFLPAALFVTGLWLTGMYLWILPYLTRASRKRRGGGLEESVG